MDHSFKFHEILNSHKGAIILSSDSYVIEKENWYQVVSPSRKYASRNEIIYSNIEDMGTKDKVEEMIKFYKNLGTSFKWCVGPNQSSSELSNVLAEKGFESWDARGMCLEVDKFKCRLNVHERLEYWL